MNKAHGFTIVELLIVIVVIAILAALSYVGYTSMQARARDSIRKSDIAAITKALHMYKAENGNMVLSGGGSGGGGIGWFNIDYDGSAPAFKSMARLLVESGAMSSEVADPINNTSCTAANEACRAYMKHTCSSGTFLYASLESEPTKVDGPTNSTCAPTWDTAYGMNYVVKVE